MPMKGQGAAELREIDRFEGGVGWLAHPTEDMQRASHAIAVDDEVWVVDPVDAPGLDDLLASVGGSVAGVVVGLDRHKRDAATVANRHDVPVYVPDWMTGVASKLDAPVERFGRTLTDDVRAITIVNKSLPPWQEVGLYHESTGTLVVPEAVGTAEYFRAPGERLGVHPMLRAFPPTRALSGLDPERVLVGHGEGVFDDAATALTDALENARRRLPAAYARAFKNLF